MKNLPTIITSSRFIFAILVAFLLCFNSDMLLSLAVILFVFGALSDALDGKLARRQKNPSRFGAFLDPIADKFLVFLVLVSLTFNRDSVALFILSLIIISREIIIMSLREWMASIQNNNIVEVSSFGKYKTFIQMCGISLVIGSPLVDDYYFNEISLSVLSAGAILGIISGFRYLKKSYKYLF